MEQKNSIEIDNNNNSQENKENKEKEEKDEKEEKPKRIFNNRPFSKTSQLMIKNKHLKLGFPFPDEFAGFFNKKFDLTLYKKNREKIRLKSKSPKKVYHQHHKKGNGIPNNLIDRISFLGKKFSEPKFLRYYNRRPEKKDYCFDETIDYIANYSKYHSQLDSIMMAFYFVCKEIKFDKDCFDNDEETKYNQKPENVFDEGLAVSSGFTNIFEYILKKMEIKYKHIDGYCKLMPKNKKLKKKSKKILSRTQSARNINEEMSKLSETVNHSWNAVYIKGEWYFCDCLLGSGSLEQEEDVITKLNLKQLDINNNLYNYNNNMTNANNTKSAEPIDTFNFFYFMIPPEYLIVSHRPIDDNWQFIYKTLSFKQFYNKRLINYGEFYINAYKYNVKLLTHKNPFILITTKDKLKIKIKILGHVIEANLFYFFGGTKIAEVKYLYEESSESYVLEPIFPQKGEYILKINARANKSTDLLYWPLIDYIIKVDSYFHIGNFNTLLSSKEAQDKEKDKEEDILPKLNRSSSLRIITPKIISDYSKVFPPKSFKKICYDNEDFRLIEPRSNYLKRGATTRFKVIVKGAINVSILDGNHLTSLRKFEDGVFIGEKEIETNNVSLCCLRGKNVYTEIYKFKVVKEGRIMSSKPIIPHKKKVFFK